MRVEEILGKIIEFPFFVFCILTLSKRRFPLKGTAVFTAAIALPYMLAAYLIINNWHYVIYAYPALDLSYRILNLLLMAVAALCLTRQRFVQSLFIMASTYVGITIIDVLAVAVLMMTDIPEVLVKCLLYLTISALIFRARKPFTGILTQTKKGWWLLCSVPLFLIINFLLVSAIPVTLEHNPGRMPAALILCGTSIIIYINFFYMMWDMYKQNQTEQNLMALRLSVTALEDQNELVVQNEKQNALFRHDLRHITQMMSTCLDNGDVDSIRTLLTKLCEDAEVELNSPVQSFTGHRLPDAVLSRYVRLAGESGVEFLLRVGSMDSVAADKTELAVVLSNALENAFSACLLMPEGRRIIRLDGHRRGAQYFLEIANTFTGDVQLDDQTVLPVSERDGHGLGSQSIAFFAQKHNAALQYRIEGEWFHLRLLL